MLNDVVYTQVCVSFGPDEVTREVARRLLADGLVDDALDLARSAVLRISVSNWRTTEDVAHAQLQGRVLAEVRG